MKRIMVDMSATIIHHGHIRLLKKAKEYGKVIVGLTSDEEILNKKGYIPELKFEYRKESLESIKYVDEVVVTPWLLTNETLEKYNIDLLVHGSDNSNEIDEDKLLVFPRTEGISSTDIRKRACEIIRVKENNSFDIWNEVKKKTDKKDLIVTFRVREIFWVRIGENIGSEEFGKGHEFQRPVLIVRVLTPYLFIGVPLTSKTKENNDYFQEISFNTKKGVSKNSAMLLQVRTFDKKRLMGKIGKLNKEDFNIIIEKLQKLFIPS